MSESEETSVYLDSQQRPPDNVWRIEWWWKSLPKCTTVLLYDNEKEALEMLGTFEESSRDIGFTFTKYATNEELECRLAQIEGMTTRIFDLEKRLADAEAIVAVSKSR